MDRSTLIYIVTMGWTLIIYGGITYIIAKRKDYMLLSGFHRRPKEEQEFLHKSGYLEATGKLLVVTFWMFFATFLLGLIPVPFGFEIGISVFMLTLLGGLVWVQRYEVPHKRKKMTWIISSISGATVLLVVGVIVMGYLGNDAYVEEDTFTITGSYGIEWNISEIETVELLKSLPEIEMKTNGFATGTLLKGKFRLEAPYGTGLLFIDKKSDAPVLYVAKKDEYIMMNRIGNDDAGTLYKELLMAME